MKFVLKNQVVKLSFLIGFMFFFSNIAWSQTLINNTTTPITRDFTNLAAGSWVNNTYANAQGWYVNFGASPTVPSSIFTSDGSGTSASRPYTLGLDGTQRSFGIVANGAAGVQSYIGWRLKNNTGAVVNNLQIHWKGKQWYRNELGGNQTIVLSYRKSSSEISNLTGTYTNLSPIFNTPQPTGANSLLNGNLAENSAEVTNNINGLNLAPGDEIMLRWIFTSNPHHHVFGLDDITITYIASQTITFPAITNKTYGDAPITLSATASSGLPVTYSSSNSNVASISGSTLTITGPGRATITATQAGNDDYSPASTTRTIDVYPVAPTLSAATNVTTSSFRATWTINNGANDANVDYYIVYANNPSFNNDFLVYTSDKTRLINTNVSVNNVYYYKVVAYTVDSNLESDASNTRSVIIGNDYLSGTWPSGVKAANRVVISSPSAVFPNNASNTLAINSLEVTNTGRIENTQALHVENELLIRSSADGNAGQLLNRGNVTFGDNAKIIIRKTFVANQWHFMGFPFNVPQANIFLAGTSTPATWGNRNEFGNNIIVQRYNGANRDNTGSVNYSQGLNWVNVSPKTFNANQGYIVWATSNITIDFVINASNRADFFNTSASVAAGIFDSNPSFEHRNWNLFSTPFASAYELQNSAFHAPFQVYNSATQTYDAIMSTDSYEIRPYNAYFFQAKGSNFSFVNTGRRLNAPAQNSVSAYDDLHFALSNDKYRDVTRIRYHAEASNDLDIDKDAIKILSFNTEVPQLFSTIGNRSFAVNTTNSNQKEFDLNVLIPAAGTYRLSLANTSKAPNIVAVILHDKLTATMIDLMKYDTYEFTADKAGTFNRFKVITANDATNVSTNNTNAFEGELKIMASNNKARIVANEILVSVRVFDMSGKVIFAANNFDSKNEITLPNKGIYMFDIETNKGKQQIKLLNK